MAVTKNHLDMLHVKLGNLVAVREGEKTYYGHYHTHTEDRIHMFYDVIPPELTHGHGTSYTHRLNEIDDVYFLTQGLRRPGDHPSLGELEPKEVERALPGLGSTTLNRWRRAGYVETRERVIKGKRAFVVPETELPKLETMYRLTQLRTPGIKRFTPREAYRHVMREKKKNSLQKEGN